jgi:hypothetical protein
MAFELPALPNFNTTVPQQVANQPSAMDQYGRMLQLRSLLANQQQQQQLMPLQVQEQEQRVQQATLQTQQEELKVKSQQAMIKAWSDPDFSSSVTGATGSDLAPSIGFTPGFDPVKMMRSLVSKGVLPEDARAQAAGLLELSKNLSMKTKDDLSNYKESHQQLANLLGPITNMEPEEQGPALDAVKQKVQSGAIPGLDPRDIALLQQADPTHLQPVINLTGVGSDIADFHKKNLDVQSVAADVWKKELENDQTANPLLKMQLNPTEAFSGDKLPASLAYLQTQAKSSDPKTATLATQLLGVANTSKNVELAIDKSKKQAAQSVQDGDPNAAGQLLVDGTVAPSQIISARKPEFAQKAFSAAAQLQPGWDARKAEADFKVASSPQQVAFFGSAKSLTDKGGTLDQLAAAGKDIPEGQIPIFNTVADAIKASTGSGPIAKYAAVALGVADDYSKVMGGGQGSDTMRTQALNLISAKQSPEQRAASIEGIRGAVSSQTNSRIGNNSVLQKMYGGSGATTKTMAVAQGFTRIQASDGSLHDIPTGNLQKAKQRDPGLTVQ